MNKKEKLFEEYKNLAFDLAKGLKENFPEIIGISICGSVACGNSDEYSDIDLDLWLPDKVYKKWLIDCPLMEHFKQYSINRETPHNFSFGIRDDYKFDITILSIDEVREEEWKVEQKANRYNYILIFDTDSRIRNLLDEKLALNEESFGSKERYSAINPNPKEYYHFFISAYLNYNVPIAIVRKKFEQSHLNLTWALNLLLELLWTKHSKFYPYMKSRWFVVDKYLNDEQKELIREAQLIKEYSEEDVKRRRRVLRELYKKLGYNEVIFYHEKVDLS